MAAPVIEREEILASRQDKLNKLKLIKDLETMIEEQRVQRMAAEKARIHTLAGRQEKRKKASTNGKEATKPPSLQDLNNARVWRGMFEWRLYAPGLKEALTGSFFKMRWPAKDKDRAPTYSIQQILDVERDDKRIYDVSIDGSKKWCGLFAKIRYKDRAHSVPFTAFSRHKFTEDEFRNWLRGSEEVVQVMPQKGEVQTKAVELDEYFGTKLDETSSAQMRIFRDDVAKVAREMF